MEDRADMSVMAVVVTYNRKELLKECINALLDQTYKNLDILIIDNASTDGTESYIKDYMGTSRIYYRNTHRNIGGAGGFNYGMKIAVKANYDYLWLMDDDVIPMPDALEQLMDAVDELDQKFGFLSSYVQYTDGTICDMNIPDIKQVQWLNSRKFLQDGLIEIERASFVSFLVPKKIVEKVGLPIKEFFIWADDTEYSKRISKDFPCYYVNNSVVTHKTKANTGASNEAFINNESKDLSRFRYKYRNLFYIAKEEGPKSVFHYFLTFAWINLKIIRARKYRLRKWAVLWAGFIQGIFFNPRIEYMNKN